MTPNGMLLASDRTVEMVKPLCVFIALMLVAVSLSAPGTADAKGQPTIVIGGSDLGGYYYAIPEEPPVNGWLGLLPNEFGHPVGRITAPPDAEQLLEAAYELYFDYLPDALEGPSAYYVPASAAHPSYLYWVAASGGIPYVSWFELPPQSAAYLDAARISAKAEVQSYGSLLERDPIAAIIRHGRYFTGLEGASIHSDRYLIMPGQVPPDATEPLATISGADSPLLIDAYIATLHQWHVIDSASASPSQYRQDVTDVLDDRTRTVTIFTPEGRPVFSFVRGDAQMPPRVFAAEGYGGYFDATPELMSLILGALGESASSRSVSVEVLVAVIVSSLFVTGTVAAVLVRRRAWRRR